MQRRTFLASLAAGTAWTATRSVGPAHAAPSWPLRLSCSSIAFSSLSIEEACDRIAGLGFEAIDIWSPHAKCPHLDDVQNRLGPGGLADLLAKHRLKLCAFSVYAGGYPKYAELLGKVGGGLAIRGSAKRTDPNELTAAMRKFLEELKPSLELAEQHNSRLAIENHGNALLDSADSFKAFVDLNRSPRLGLAIAPYHLQGVDASVEEVIAIAGKQLFFFYAWQRGKDLEQLPGQGAADFVPWLSALAKIAYPHFFNPFMHHEPPPNEMLPAMARASEYLRLCHIRIQP